MREPVALPLAKKAGVAHRSLVNLSSSRVIRLEYHGSLSAQHCCGKKFISPASNLACAFARCLSKQLRATRNVGRTHKSGLNHGIAPASETLVKEFLCACCAVLIAAPVFYFLTLREISQITPKLPGVATTKQLNEMSEIALKDSGDATTKQPKEIREIAFKDPGVPTAKESSKLRRELEIAITRAERALADAEEASQEDELGASERRYLASELKQMAAEARASAEATERRSKQTIREIHIAEAKAARARLRGLKAQLAKTDSEAAFSP